MLHPHQVSSHFSNTNWPPAIIEPAMNYYHILPSAPQLMRLGTSAMNQVLATLKSIGVEAPKANAEFDIDNEMGFLPSRPLHRLPEAFDFWERALSDAASMLSLGEDESPEAISKRAGSEQWRARIREVSNVDPRMGGLLMPISYKRVR